LACYATKFTAAESNTHGGDLFKSKEQDSKSCCLNETAMAKEVCISNEVEIDDRMFFGGTAMQPSAMARQYDLDSW
jgi:hypothetical protein